MNKKLFVGNLSSEVTEQDLEANFSSIGPIVSVAIIRDKFTGLSKGFGFVEMESEAAAKEAIEKFNGGELRGKSITVNEARPKKDMGGPRRDGRPGGGGGYRGGAGGGGYRGGGGGRRY